MQEVLKDGTIGETHTAETLEDLLPKIKKALEKSHVDYVKLFKAGPEFKSEEKIDQIKAILGT